jgi:hypothetical protein
MIQVEEHLSSKDWVQTNTEKTKELFAHLSLHLE